MERDKKFFTPAEMEEAITGLTVKYETALAEQKQRIFDLKKQLADDEKRLKEYKDKSELVSKALISAVAKAEEIDKLSKLKYSQELAQLKIFHDKWISHYEKILKKYPLDDELIAADEFNRKMSKILLESSAPQPEIIYEDEKKRLESRNLGEKQIGYIRVKTEEESEEDDDGILKELIPDMPEAVGDSFNPLNRIKSYLKKTPSVAETENAVERALPDDSAAARQDANDYKDRSASGFSFEEALHPKQELSEIMKELGLLLED